MLPPRKCTIHVRHLALGGAAPIAVQSMAATRTQDVEATLRQVKLLDDAGADLVRIAADSKADVAALATIRARSKALLSVDSTPHAWSMRSTKWSSPGRPIVVHDLLVATLEDRAPDASADVVERGLPAHILELARAAFALPLQGFQDPLRIWLIVAGPFAHVRPREPGCTGLPSNFVMRCVSLSTYATRPQADSQLKQIVGTSA